MDSQNVIPDGLFMVFPGQTIRKQQPGSDVHPSRIVRTGLSVVSGQVGLPRTSSRLFQDSPLAGESGETILKPVVEPERMARRSAKGRTFAAKGDTER
jgi:hypothetical protein